MTRYCAKEVLPVFFLRLNVDLISCCLNSHASLYIRRNQSDFGFGFRHKQSFSTARKLHGDDDDGDDAGSGIKKTTHSVHYLLIFRLSSSIKTRLMLMMPP